MKAIRPHLADAAIPIAFFILMLALWEMGYRLHWWNENRLPGPSGVVRVLLSGIQDGSLFAALCASLWRMAVAFVLALLLGAPLGLLIGGVPALRSSLGALIQGLQALPAVCWVPFALLWFGASEQAILFVALIGALLAMTLTVSEGVQAIPPLTLRAARMMGAQGWHYYRNVLFPASVPALISGARQGWAFAWRSLMSGELLAQWAGAVGLGQTLMQGRNDNDLRLMLAVMVILVGIGIVADQLIFARLEHRIRRHWGLVSA